MEYLNAFLCGGILCAAGQILIDKTNLTPARILVGYVVYLRKYRIDAAYYNHILEELRQRGDMAAAGQRDEHKTNRGYVIRTSPDR